MKVLCVLPSSEKNKICDSDPDVERVLAMWLVTLADIGDEMIDGPPLHSSWPVWLAKLFQIIFNRRLPSNQQTQTLNPLPSASQSNTKQQTFLIGHTKQRSYQTLCNKISDLPHAIMKSAEIVKRRKIATPIQLIFTSVLNAFKLLLLRTLISIPLDEVLLV